MHFRHQWGQALLGSCHREGAHPGAGVTCEGQAEAVYRSRSLEGGGQDSGRLTVLEASLSLGRFSFHLK